VWGGRRRKGGVSTPPLEMISVGASAPEASSMTLDEILLEIWRLARGVGQAFSLSSSEGRGFNPAVGDDFSRGLQPLKPFP